MGSKLYILDDLLARRISSDADDVTATAFSVYITFFNAAVIFMTR